MHLFSFENDTIQLLLSYLRLLETGLHHSAFTNDLTSLYDLRYHKIVTLLFHSETQSDTQIQFFDYPWQRYCFLPIGDIFFCFSSCGRWRRGVFGLRYGGVTGEKRQMLKLRFERSLHGS